MRAGGLVYVRGAAKAEANEGPGGSPTSRGCDFHLGTRRGAEFRGLLTSSKTNGLALFVGGSVFSKRVGIIGVSGTAVSCCVELARFRGRFRTINGGCGRIIHTLGGGFKRGQTVTLLCGLRELDLRLVLVYGGIVTLARRCRQG